MVIGSYHQKYYYYIHMLSSYSSQLVKMVLFIKLLHCLFAIPYALGTRYWIHCRERDIATMSTQLVSDLFSSQCQ